MDDDDILRHLNVDEDHWGIPRWRKHMTKAQLRRLQKQRAPSPQPSPKGRGSAEPSPQPSPSEGRGGQTPAPAAGYVPIGLHPDGRPIVRHLVHVQDLVDAFLLALANPASVGQTFNIAAPSAFAYDQAGEYLSGRTGVPTMRIKVPGVHDFTIDISKARAILGYQPRRDIFRIIDAALEQRARLKS
jgi:hypothetical protein